LEIDLIVKTESAFFAVCAYFLL